MAIAGYIPLQNIQIVDLRDGHSVWDKEKSKPKKGQFEIEKEEVIRIPRSYHNPGRPPVWFSWATEEVLNEWKYAWGFEPVVAGKDPYWPKPLTPDAEGWYRNGDAILVACPLKNYLEKRELAENESKLAAKDKTARFNDEMAAQGANVPQDWIDARTEQLQSEQELDPEEIALRKRLHLIR